MLKIRKPQESRRIRRQKTPDDQQPVPHAQHPITQLQSIIGNKAVQRDIIQRMPTRTQIVSALGAPKKNFGLIKNSTKYKLVLDRVDAYDRYILNTTLGGDMNAIKGQMQQVMTLLQNVMSAVTAYDGDKGRKAAYMQNLKSEIKRDITSASLATLKLMKGPIPNLKPKLFIVLTSANTGTLALDNKNIAGKDRGGTSEVTRFDQDGKSGFFKENKETLANWSTNEEEKALKDEATQGLDKDESFLVKNALNNEKGLGVGMVGIDAKDARMAQRDVAMYRLDQLLEGNVIAKAEIATRTTPKGTVYGSFMEGAKGKSGINVIKEGKMSEDDTEKSTSGPGAISRTDPTLMRLLSRLQLIDLLGFQIDRKPDNYFIQFDGTGKVIGITGIDNDFSMGTKTNFEKRRQELPGISRYVDEEMANKILTIDLDLVKLVMADLLSQAEIDALVERFTKLRAALQPLKDGGKLLKPDQWDDAVTKGLLDEDKSYFSDISFFKGKFGPKKKT